MLPRLPFVASALVVVLLPACARSTPRARVAADLGCTTEATEVTRIAPRDDRPNTGRWQVTGCGKTAVYLCTEPVRDCWREGDIQTVNPVEGAP